MPVDYQQDHTQLTLVGCQTGHISLSIVLEKRLRYNLLNTSWLLPVVLGGSIDRRQAKTLKYMCINSYLPQKEGVCTRIKALGNA